MTLDLTQDIKSITELKKHTHQLLEQVHATGRPIFLTVNGKADAVLIDVKAFEKHLRAANMAKLLAEAERDISEGKTRSMKDFLKEFKNARKI